MKFIIEADHVGSQSALTGDELILASGSTAKILAVLPHTPTSDTLRAARAGATNIADAYGFTIDSIEPDISLIDAGAYYASAAISLKRIADVLEAREARVVAYHAKTDKEF